MRIFYYIINKQKQNLSALRFAITGYKENLRRQLAINRNRYKLQVADSFQHQVIAISMYAELSNDNRVFVMNKIAKTFK